MNALPARVTAIERIAGGLVELWFEAEPASLRVRAGQFLMLLCGDGFDPLLRRRVFYSSLRVTAAGVLEGSLLGAMAEQTGAWLAARRPGDLLDVIGPFGEGFAPARGARHLLLAGEGKRVAPLLLAAGDAVARGFSVTLLQHGTPVYPAALLPHEVEAAAPVHDGSDLTAAFLHLAPWADHVLLSLDEPLLQQLAGELRRSGSRKPVDAVRWDALPCGTGLCGACGVETRRGRRRLCCVDGPVFALNELY